MVFGRGGGLKPLVEGLEPPPAFWLATGLGCLSSRIIPYLVCGTCVEKETMWQRQQPIDVTGASVGRPVRQGLYVSLPYQTDAVVHSYRQGQSTLVGVLLIAAGCVGAVFNVVDLGIGSQDKWKGDFMFYTRSFSLSQWSNGVVGHGFWCGIMVSVLCNVCQTRGQSNLTKSASRGAHSPVRGHPRGCNVR